MQKWISWFNGFVLVLLVTLASYALAASLNVVQIQLSPLILSVLLGILASPFFRSAKHSCEAAVEFSTKKLLRIGIILYGFNVTLQSLASIGFIGILLSVLVVVIVLVVGYGISRWLKMDKEIAILVSCGSAICGAAAVLALESTLKSKPYKGAIAVGSVVVFGLLGMFLYPLMYFALPFDFTQMGYYVGLTSHEIANVIGAGAAIAHQTQEVALLVKMIRVLLLVPVLFIIPYCFAESREGKARKIQIPWFAFWFLGVVFLHSFIAFPEVIVESLRFLSGFFLVMAMSALGLQIELKKFLEFGGDAFILALILFGFLLILGFLLVWSMV